MGIRTEKSGAVTTIIIDNPGVKNAVDGPTAEALARAFRQFEEDKRARIAVLWGDHGCFCSGANLKAISEGKGNRIESSGLLHVLVQILDRVPNGPHLLGVLVGNVHSELLLEGHHELDRVERVGPEILDE